MTSTTFINRFNNGSLKDIGNLFIELDLKEPDQHLAAKYPAPSLASEVHIMAYGKVRAGIWYMKTKEGERLTGSAFRLYPEGERSFNAWVKTLPQKKWAKKLKDEFIQAFDKIVMPEYTDN